jgi:hypothetical protein
MSTHQPNKQTDYHQGYYKIQHVHKYLGNPAEIVYRSSWEFKFMLYCDLNPGVIKWCSEMYRIPYVDFKGKQRTYIPDFYIETQGEEKLNRFLIEIKPEQETKEPEIPKGTISKNKLKGIEYQCAAWIKNKHKWAFTVEWCKNRDIEFKIVTEHYINRLKA